eukprot:1751815-Rhodomonas_salina.5
MAASINESRTRNGTAVPTVWVLSSWERPEITGTNLWPLRLSRSEPSCWCAVPVSRSSLTFLLPRRLRGTLLLFPLVKGPAWPCCRIGAITSESAPEVTVALAAGPAPLAVSPGSRAPGRFKLSWREVMKSLSWCFSASNIDSLELEAAHTHTHTHTHQTVSPPKANASLRVPRTENVLERSPSLPAKTCSESTQAFQVLGGGKEARTAQEDSGVGLKPEQGRGAAASHVPVRLMRLSPGRGVLRLLVPGEAEASGFRPFANGRNCVRGGPGVRERERLLPVVVQHHQLQRGRAERPRRGALRMGQLQNR